MDVRLQENTAIKECLLEYDLFQKMPIKYGTLAAKLIERSILNASIDKATERNIPKYWDNQEFIDQYSNIGYMIKMNISISSSILRDQPDYIKFYAVQKVYNYVLKKYLEETPLKKIPKTALEKLPTIDITKIGYMNSQELNPHISKSIRDEIKLREKEKIILKYSTLYKCYRCNERKTNVREVQKRRGDEGSTLEITCLECGYQWNFNN